MAPVVTRSGQILDERYRLDKRIAAGGVGQVWRVTDLLLQRPVAVKVLRPEYADHPDTLERFSKEARLAGALSHPHVAQVYDYGPGGPMWPPYLVLEFVDGPSLADVLAVDPVEPEFALDVVAQAAEGLYAAHRANLVHRDVKPGNLLIGPERRVKVTDFGIAARGGSAPVTAPNLVMGTTQYMAPERIAGRPASPASDLYALGIVLHECLTGVPPYEGAPPGGDGLSPLPSAAAAARRRAARAGRPGRAAHRQGPGPADQRRARPGRPGGRAARGDDVRPVRRVRGGRRLGGGACRRERNANRPSHRGHGSDDRPAPGQAPGSGPAGDGGGAPGTGADGAGPAATPGYAGYSDEWAVPDRRRCWRSRPEGFTGPGQPGLPPDQRRRQVRSTTLMVGAAVVAAIALIVLLITGAFRTAPQANVQPAQSPTTASLSPGARPSHSTARDGGPAAPGVTPTGGTSSPTASKKPTATPSARTSSTAPPSGSPATAPGSSPGEPTSPNAPPSTQAPPSTPVGTTPTDTPSQPAPSPTHCVLGICL